MVAGRKRRDNEHFRLHPFERTMRFQEKKLEKVTGLSDRDIREEIAMARRNTVILKSIQWTRGIFL